MQLLGKYNSSISSYLYDNLLALFQSSLQSGGQGGSSNVSQADLQALATQASTLSAVPLPSAGQKTNSEQFNYPINVELAKYNSIQQELSQFIANATALLQNLNLETQLLDSIIAQAQLVFWESQILQPYDCTSFSWDYNQGIGNVSTDVPITNPATSLSYTSNTNIKNIYNVTTGARSGLVPPFQEQIVTPTNLSWSFTTSGQSETLYTNSSAQLSILESQAEVNYLPNPITTVLLPNNGSIQGVFNIGGSTTAGPINTYIRTGFYPTYNTVNIKPTNAIDTTYATWVYENLSHSETAASTEVGPNGTFNLAGTLTSNLFTNALGTYVIGAGQTLYIETTLSGTIGGGQMYVYIDCYDTNYNLINSIDLNNPTANNATYIWYQEVVLPTSSATSAKLRYVTTDTSWTISNPRVHVPIFLTNYQVVLSTVTCYTVNSQNLPLYIYNSNTQFYIDQNSLLTFFNVPDGPEVTVTFQELFPYYQCSLNQISWSPIVLLNANKPYPDDLPIKHLVKVVDGAFPITNEEGVPNGLTLSLIGTPLYNYEFVVGVNANPNWGKQAVLEVDLEYANYINQINVKPFSNFFPVLTQVVIQGLNSTLNTSVFNGRLELSEETRIEFNPQIVGKVFLHFTQEGYSANEHMVVDTNYVLRSVMYNIQNLLPQAAQSNVVADYETYIGYQYDFGIGNLYAVNTTLNTGVTVSGPYRFTGQPVAVTYQAVIEGTVNSYLYFKAVTTTGVIAEFETTGSQITPGQSLVIPYQGSTSLTSLAYVDFYIKHVLTTNNSTVTRFTLQVNDNV